MQRGGEDGFRRALAEVNLAVDRLAAGGPSSDQTLQALAQQGRPQLPSLLAAALTARPYASTLLHDLVSCAGLGLEDELRLALTVCDAASVEWQADGA